MTPEMDPPELPEIGVEKEPMDPPPGFDEFDDEPEPEPEQIADGVQRRRGRKKRQHTEVTKHSPARAITNEELRHLDDSFDLWMAGFDWSRPGVYCTLKRVAPTYAAGVPVGGELGQKKNSPFTYDEIQSRWGGGEFRISVFGPKSENDSRMVPLNNKMFMIPGQPFLDEDALPEETRTKMQQQGGPYNRGPRPPDPATRAMDHMEREVERMRNAPDQSDKLAAVYNQTMGVVQQAATEKAAASAAAADERAKMSFTMMEREREDRSKLEQHVRNMEKATMEKETQLREQLAKEIQGAQAGSMGLISALLPQMTAANSDTTKMIIAQYAAKESSLIAQHQNDINNLDRMHQAQLQAINNNSEQQLRHIEMLHKNNVTLLEAQLVAVRAECDAVKRQLDDARREVDKARNDLMTRVIGQKETDPLDQMAKMSEIIQMARGFGGGGDKEEGIGAGLDDNPMLANVFKLLDKGIPVAQEYFAQRRGQQQGPPPQAYVPQPQYQQMQPPPPQPRPRPMPRPLPPPEPKMDREEVREAINFINGLISQPEPAPPEETAAGAISLLPNDMLKQLCRRTPEKLIVALETEGMLTGPSATEQGKAYLTKLLHALKKKFKERGDMPPPVQGG